MITIDQLGKILGPAVTETGFGGKPHPDTRVAAHCDPIPPGNVRVHFGDVTDLDAFWDATASLHAPYVWIRVFDATGWDHDRDEPTGSGYVSFPEDAIPSVAALCWTGATA